MIKNLVSEQLAWVIARLASKERKLLSQREKSSCPGRRDGFFFKPWDTYQLQIMFINIVIAGLLLSTCQDWIRTWKKEIS